MAENARLKTIAINVMLEIAALRERPPASKSAAGISGQPPDAYPDNLQRSVIWLHIHLVWAERMP